jgi:hypothetical protein
MSATPLRERIALHLAMLAPHQRERATALLLREAADELDRLSAERQIEAGEAPSQAQHLALTDGMGSFGGPAEALQRNVCGLLMR